MSETRVIKKYPNRRLYDTEISQYITLDDVKKLVLNGVEFHVKEVKSGDDLTRSTLLQIIAEQEHEGKPLFNTLMLTQLIRFYGNAYQSTFSEYLQKSLEIFTSQQQNIQKNFTESVTQNPFTSTMAEMTEQNISMWRQVQDNFFNAVGGTTADNKDED